MPMRSIISRSVFLPTNNDFAKESLRISYLNRCSYPGLGRVFLLCHLNNCLGFQTRKVRNRELNVLQAIATLISPIIQNKTSSNEERTLNDFQCAFSYTSSASVIFNLQVWERRLFILYFFMHKKKRVVANWRYKNWTTFFFVYANSPSMTHQMQAEIILKKNSL